MRAYTGRKLWASILLSWVTAAGAAQSAHTTSLGIFEGHADVGSMVPGGTSGFDGRAGNYTLTAAGANTWYHVDAFHYLWKRASGDWALTADVSFPPPTYAHPADPHRKGILTFRQSLDPGSVHASVGVHGSGMTALQYRGESGANTEDIELNIDAPRTVRIEKRGDIITLYLSMRGEPLHPVGASATVRLKAPYYVGLGAVSHDDATTDTVRFAHVSLRPLGAVAGVEQRYSTLRIIQTEDQFRRAMVIRSAPVAMQSVNWNAGGRILYVHEDGRVKGIPLLDPAAGGEARDIDTGGLEGCSGNFGLSPDGSMLALSCERPGHGAHAIYLLPSAGGASPRQLTTGSAGSFFHAWSPDGRTIAFTRGSASRADIFTIPAAGGTETRLTTDTVNDGPDYSPDGQFLYFDSARSGSLQIWRMHPDGSAAQQITADDRQNSSPHMSPDGKTLAFLSGPRHAAAGIGDASIRIMSGGEGLGGDGLIRTLVDFQGDRSSFAMYSWGDANHLAFISRQRLPQEIHP
jgi:TolB protein